MFQNCFKQIINRRTTSFKICIGSYYIFWVSVLLTDLTILPFLLALSSSSSATALYKSWNFWNCNSMMISFEQKRRFAPKGLLWNFLFFLGVCENINWVSMLHDSINYRMLVVYSRELSKLSLQWHNIKIWPFLECQNPNYVFKNSTLIKNKKDWPMLFL